MSTVLELGDVQRWLAVLLLVATLALEILDLLREWPTRPPPITADECLDLCWRSGVGVQAWTWDGCTCQGADEEG